MDLTHTVLAASSADSVGHGRSPRSRCRTPFAADWPSRPPTTGRCLLCRQRIGTGTATVELVATATTAISTWHSPNPLTLATLLWTSWHGIIRSYVDLAVHWLTDRLTQRVFIGATVLVTAAVANTGAWRQLVSAVIGTTTMAGPAAAVTGLIATVAISAIAGPLLLPTRQVQRQQAIAHGPIRLTGTLTAFLEAT